MMLVRLVIRTLRRAEELQQRMIHSGQNGDGQ